MVAQKDARPPGSLEEWRELERTSHDLKHEYIDGRVYAMSGVSLAHGRTAGKALRAIEDALATAGRACNVYNSDVAARLSARRYTYPDVSVSCDPRDDASPDKTEVQVPCVIVEVLSDSTEAYDCGRKFGYYRGCAHVQEYVLIGSRDQEVEVYRRTPLNWTFAAYGPGDEVELPSIGVRLPVSALYRNAGVPAGPDDAEGEV